MQVVAAIISTYCKALETLPVASLPSHDSRTFIRNNLSQRSDRYQSTAALLKSIDLAILTHALAFAFP
jgi:hypothetical protein